MAPLAQAHGTPVGITAMYNILKYMLREGTKHIFLRRTKIPEVLECPLKCLLIK